MGTGIGLGVVIVLDRHFMRFSTDGPVWQRLARLVVGAVVVVVLREGLSLVFPDVGEAFYGFSRTLRYSLVGLWVAFVGPWLFLVLGLAKSAHQ